MSLAESQNHPDFNQGNNPVAMDTDSDTSSNFEGVSATEPTSDHDANGTDDTPIEQEQDERVFIRVPKRPKNAEVERYRRKFNNLAKLYYTYLQETDRTRNHLLLVEDELERLMLVKRQLCARLSSYNDKYMDQNLEIPDNNHLEADVRRLIDDVLTNAEQAGGPAAKKKKSEKKSAPRPRETAPEHEEPEAYEAIKNILNAATSVIQQQQQEQEDMIRRREVDQKKADAAEKVAKRAKATPRTTNAANISVMPLSTASSASTSQSVSVNSVQSTPMTVAPQSSVQMTTHVSTTSQPQAHVQSYPNNSQSQMQSSQSFVIPVQTTQNVTSVQSKLVTTSVSQANQGVVDTKVYQTNYGSSSNAPVHPGGDQYRKKISHDHYVPPRIPPQKNVHIETFPTTNPRNPVQHQHPQVTVQRVRVSEAANSNKQHHHVVLQQPQFSQGANNMQQTVSVSQMNASGIRYVKPPMTQSLPRSQSFGPAVQHAQDANAGLGQHRNVQSHGATIQQGIVQGRGEPVKVYYNAMRADSYQQRDGMNVQQQHQQHPQQQSQQSYHQQRSDINARPEQRQYVDPAASAPIEGQRQVIQVMQQTPVPQSAPPARSQPRLREALQNAGNERARQLQQQQGIPLSMQHLPNVHRAPLAKSPKSAARIPHMIQQQMQQQQQTQVVQLGQINQMNPNNNVIYIDQSRYIRVASSSANINQYVIPADSVIRGDMPYAINAQGGYNSPVRYIIPQGQQIPQQTALIAQRPPTTPPNPVRIRKDSARVNQNVTDDNIDWSVYNEPKSRSPKKSSSPRKRTTAIKLDSNSEAMARISPILAKFQQEMAQSTLAQEQQHQQQLTMAARNAVKVTPARARKRPTKAEREAAQKAKLAQQQSVNPNPTTPATTAPAAPAPVSTAPAPAPVTVTESTPQNQVQEPQPAQPVPQPAQPVAPVVTAPAPDTQPSVTASTDTVTVSTPVATKASDIVGSIPTIIVTAATPEPKSRKPSDPDLNATTNTDASSSQSTNANQA